MTRARPSLLEVSEFLAIAAMKDILGDDRCAILPADDRFSHRRAIRSSSTPSGSGTQFDLFFFRRFRPQAHEHVVHVEVGPFQRFDGAFTPADVISKGSEVLQVLLRAGISQGETIVVLEEALADVIFAQQLKDRDAHNLLPPDAESKRLAQFLEPPIARGVTESGIALSQKLFVERCLP